MQITNGSITFERNRKTADYEGKKASVTLSFLIAEGENAEVVASHVGVLAMNRALLMVGEQAMTDALQPAGQFPAHELPAAPPTVPAAATRGRKSPPPSVTQPSPAAAPEAVSASSAAPLSDAASDPLAATAVPATSAAAAIGALTPASFAVDPRLTDVGLRQACQQKVENAADKQAMTGKLKALIVKYSGDPMKPIQSVTDAAKRGEFLVELGKL